MKNNGTICCDKCGKKVGEWQFDTELGIGYGLKVDLVESKECIHICEDCMVRHEDSINNDFKEMYIRARVVQTLNGAEVFGKPENFNPDQKNLCRDWEPDMAFLKHEVYGHPELSKEYRRHILSDGRTCKHCLWYALSMMGVPYCCHDNAPTEDVL